MNVRRIIFPNSDGECAVCGDTHCTELYCGDENGMIATVKACKACLEARE